MNQFKRFNRKGTTIPLNFIVSLLLAILIFGSGIMIASNFLRLSDQGIDSFNGLTETVDKFLDERDKVKTSYLLIMDEKTAVIGFSKGKETLLYQGIHQIDEEKQSGTGMVIDSVEIGYLIKHKYPSSFCEQDCLCLCRDLKSEEEIPAGNIDDYSCENLICKDFPEGTIKPFSQVRKEDDSVRRRILILTKENDQIVINGG
jgi:hypothetical protein